MKSNPASAYKKKELAGRLKINYKKYPQFRTTLKLLYQNGLITKVHGGRIMHTPPNTYITGKLAFQRSGRGMMFKNGKKIFINCQK